MKEFSITIHGLNDILGFVELAQAQPFSITVGNDHQEVNGKGHIGLCALDYSAPVWIWSEDCLEKDWDMFCATAKNYVLT